MCTTLPTISSQSDLLIKVGNDFADSHAVPDVPLRDCNFTQGKLQQQLTISLAMVRNCFSSNANMSLIDPLMALYKLQCLQKYRKYR